MNRRAFLLAVAAVPLAPLLGVRQRLAGHELDAIMEQYVRPAMAQIARDMDTGMAIRFVQQWDVKRYETVQVGDGRMHLLAIEDTADA